MTPATFRLIHPLKWAVLLPLAAFAAPLDQTTSVHLEPEADAPVLRVLEPGSDATTAPDARAPEGWTALLLPGPHDVYVENKDITKSLDVKPGAALRLQSSTDAPVVARASENEPVEITGLRGRWTQLRLNRPLTGYARIAAPASPASPAATRDTSVATSRLRDAPPAPQNGSARSAPPAQGRAVPLVDRGDGGVAALPRLFEGRFVSTRAPFRPRRPYDYALEDAAGSRIAYVDLSKILLTDQIENYTGRTVAAFGTARPVQGTKDIVVIAESLQLR